jgi:hypothetical protein
MKKLTEQQEEKVIKRIITPLIIEEIDTTTKRTYADEMSSHEKLV